MTKGVCQKCEDNSTKFIENALFDINRDTSIKLRTKGKGNGKGVHRNNHIAAARGSGAAAVATTTTTTMAAATVASANGTGTGNGKGASGSGSGGGSSNCTPSDFIDSVYKFTDESSGALKVGLDFRVKDILARLATNRGVEDRPTANYRTSLHSDTISVSNKGEWSHRRRR